MKNRLPQSPPAPPPVQNGVPPSQGVRYDVAADPQAPPITSLILPHGWDHGRGFRDGAKFVMHERENPKNDGPLYVLEELADG